MFIQAATSFVVYVTWEKLLPFSHRISPVMKEKQFYEMNSINILVRPGGKENATFG